MTRFLRPTGYGTWDVYLDGEVVGHVALADPGPLPTKGTRMGCHAHLADGQIPMPNGSLLSINADGRPPPTARCSARGATLTSSRSATATASAGRPVPGCRPRPRPCRPPTTRRTPTSPTARPSAAARGTWGADPTPLETALAGWYHWVVPEGRSTR